MNERFTKRDYRFIAVCAVMAVASLMIVGRYFYRAFPEASIRFEVSREQSTPLATQFLQRLGLDTDGYRHNVTFDYDGRAKTFLEKEMGLERAIETLGTRIRIWRWSHRWFRPLQKEELRVEVTPAGEIAGYQHEIPEDAPGGRLAADPARAVAERFLLTVIGRDASRLEFIHGKSQERRLRTDHVFTWKDPEFEFHGSSYRFEVSVLGDQVGAYREFLQLPERWARDYERLRSRNRLAGQVDGVFLALLGLGMLVVLVQRIRRRDIQWRNAMVFGAITAVLELLAALNSFPLLEAGYDTTSSYGGFISEQFLYAFLNAAAMGAAIFFLTAVGETLYRERYGSSVALGHYLSWRGLRSRSFFRSAVLGLALAAAFIAYQTGFYLFANKLGAWAPADVPYDDLLNTKIPWVFVLLGGFFPAVSEEFAFRMFSIPFIQKLVRSRWAALVLAGFIWGFGHATYPNQPFYIRGVEVGIAGVILGWIMIRYGIMATLVWHYTIDAVYSAILLVRSGNTYLVVSGNLTALIVLIPLLAALVGYWKNGGFAPEEGLTNRALGTNPEPEAVARAAPAQPVFQNQPLSRRAILITAGIVVLLLLLRWVPRERFGSFIRYDVSERQVETLARPFVQLEAPALDPSSLGSFRTAVFPLDNFDPSIAKYVLEKSGLKRLDQLYAREIGSALWSIRFFRPLEREEFTVSLDPRTRRIMAYQHIVPQDAAGDDLTDGQARARAQDFLARQGEDLSGFTLKESSSERRSARRDYTFIWEAVPDSPLNIGEARHRVRVTLVGGQIGHYSRDLKLPEDWLREREKTTTLTALLPFGRVLLAGAFGVFALFLFVQRARHGEIRWKAALFWALGLSLVSLVGNLNAFPLNLRAYSTSVDLGIAQVGWLTIDAFQTIMVFIGAVLAAALMLAIYPELSLLRSRTARGLWRRDALIGLVLGAGLMVGLRRLTGLILTAYPEAARISSLPLPGGLGTWSPALAQCTGISLASFFGLSLLGLLVHLAARYLARPRAVIGATVIIMGLIAAAEARTGAEFAWQMAMMSIPVAAAALFGRYILRNNLLAYAVLFPGLLLLQNGFDLSMQGAEDLRHAGWFLFALLLMGIAWLFLQGRGKIPALSFEDGTLPLEPGKGRNENDPGTENVTG